VKLHIHTSPSGNQSFALDKPAQLLRSSDVTPVGEERLEGESPFLLIADHAGNAVPESLGGLGVSVKDLNRHIGIDIGIHGVSMHLSAMLDAPYIYQRYSRLVIDCNRTPGNPTSIASVSDSTRVPANIGISAEHVLARQNEIFWPYQEAIRKQIDFMQERSVPPVLVAMHSFTPRHGDYPAPRPWHVGVLFNRDTRLANPLISALEREDGLAVGVNQPYAVDDDVDYAIPVHGERGGLLHVELEIRQDLIESAEGQRAWAERLARLLPEALKAAERG
jgi:predicted N-formylglutamate amidohydrolase